MIRLLCFIAAFASVAAHAQDIRYVDDVLTITMRTGQGTDFQILRTVTSGARVEVLESSNSGYSRVRLEEGTVGWVLSRYLTEQPIARVRLANAEGRVQELSRENDALRAKTEAIVAEKLQLEQQVAQLEDTRLEMTDELNSLHELTAKPKQIREQNTVLRQRIEGLEEESRLLHERNRALEEDAERAWFLSGAGVLLGGLLLGIILTRIRWRKKSSSWDSF